MIHFAGFSGHRNFSPLPVCDPPWKSAAADVVFRLWSGGPSAPATEKQDIGILYCSRGRALAMIVMMALARGGLCRLTAGRPDFLPESPPMRDRPLGV